MEGGPVSDATPVSIEAIRRSLESGLDALYRFILVRVWRDADTASELLQQTATVALRERRRPASDEEIEPWLRGIARNLIRRHCRDLKRSAPETRERIAVSRRVLVTLESEDPGRLLDDEEGLGALLGALAELSAPDQWLVYAFYRHARSAADIASELGVTVKSVESRLYRTRARLRDALDQGSDLAGGHAP